MKEETYPKNDITNIQCSSTSKICVDYDDIEVEGITFIGDDVLFKRMTLTKLHQEK